MLSRIGRSLALVLASLVAGLAPAVTVTTRDGLAVDFSQSDGSVTGLTAHGVPLPLTAAEPGGLSLRVGYPLPESAVCGFGFDTDGGPWTAARNADWEDAGPYVTWLPSEGLDGSGHLLLGDGVTTGVGMAMAAPAAVPGGAAVRISWQARSASVETMQILCVRIFDAAGLDITSSTSAPSGWGWTGTSQAHGVWGLHCEAPNGWESFEQVYTLPQAAVSIRVSLRHWTGGDHLVHVDDLRLDVIGGIRWSERTAVRGPVLPAPNGFHQQAEIPGHEVQCELDALTTSRSIRVDIRVQDLSGGTADRPLLLYWTLPVAAEGWDWWDDIDTARAVSSEAVLANTFKLADHDLSLYPFASITGDEVGLALGVPMDETVAQRFEYDPAHGLQSTWEIALSPLTTKLGPGRAEVSLTLFQHDPAWAFRSAAEKYYALFPDYFIKRTTRDGAWMYPIPPSQIPDPGDFGFAFFETWGLDETERAVCAQHGIGIYYYVEPWLAWQNWGSDPEKPSYEERVASLEAWVSSPPVFAAWVADGGVNGSGHLLLGDGATTGAGMATGRPFPVLGGDTLTIAWQARVAATDSNQILSLRVLDADGIDITQASPAPAGWFWSSTSRAHVVVGLANSAVDVWQPFSRSYALPANAAAARLSLRYWTGGDCFIHIDELYVTGSGPTTYLALTFNDDSEGVLSAQNSNWEGGDATWLRAPRALAAQAVLNASPTDATDRYLIDFHSYFWHEWAPDSWNQAWPLNSDPDLPSPNTFDLYREHWILNRLDETQGIYIDSVTAQGGVGGWENRRAEHLAVSDSPLTFSFRDGRAVQLAPQAHAEFLAPIAAEVRGRGRLMMLNLFAEAMRFHSHNGDIMGSEVFHLVETDVRSRLRRTLARQRVVSNLLQWGWDSPVYATSEQMETFIRGQLFWGFFPAVSSAGGLLSGGTPDRYFLHPELYERDRPLFRHYMPVIEALSLAGWEPVTHAAALPAADVERFGHFSRGPIYLTVRGTAGSAFVGDVTIDLAACGFGGPGILTEAGNVLTEEELAVELLSEPDRLRFAVSLDASEVGVYRFAALFFPAGDLDGDGDVDQDDVRAFEACAAGPAVLLSPACENRDLDNDGDADQADFAVLQRTLGN